MHVRKMWNFNLPSGAWRCVQLKKPTTFWRFGFCPISTCIVREQWHIAFHPCSYCQKNKKYNDATWRVQPQQAKAFKYTGIRKGTLVARSPLAARASSPRLLGKQWYLASRIGKRLAMKRPLLKNLKEEQQHGGWQAYTPTSYNMCPNTGFSSRMSFFAALLSNTSSRHSMSTSAGNSDDTSQGTLSCWRRPWASRARGALLWLLGLCWLEFWLELRLGEWDSAVSSQGTNTTSQLDFGTVTYSSAESARWATGCVCLSVAPYVDEEAVGRLLLEGVRVPQLLGESTKMRIWGRQIPWAMRCPIAAALRCVFPRLLKRARLSGNRHRLAVANPNDAFPTCSKPLCTSFSGEDACSTW